MRLDAHPLIRLSSAFLGAITITLAVLWARVVLAGDGALRPEHFLRAQPPYLLLTIAVSVPLLLYGGVIAVRAPTLGITCDDGFVVIKGMLRTRRVLVERVTDVHQTAAGKAGLYWEDERGWPKRTRIGVFSIASSSSPREAGYLVEYNASCLHLLKQWIDQNAGPGSAYRRR
ncbi:hypothetical protein [Planobispora takensis]|uniref:Uncharacterized protein n=1 Tax=Planobispora takensis TaxID=1367882 RepID=A0A8J3WX79_9ACTN|nr:hypothetical protein [Planobispora takensis]GII05621.1 hypothetical protein Pta02_76290 [Planobispora takensis]